MPLILRTVTLGHTHRTVLCLLHPDPQDPLCKQLQRRPSTLRGRADSTQPCWAAGLCAGPGSGRSPPEPNPGPFHVLSPEAPWPPGLVTPGVSPERRGREGVCLSAFQPQASICGRSGGSWGSRHRSERENLFSLTLT